MNDDKLVEKIHDLISDYYPEGWAYEETMMTELLALIRTEVNAALDRVKNAVSTQAVSDSRCKCHQCIQARGFNTCYDAFTQAIEGEKR